MFSNTTRPLLPNLLQLLSPLLVVIVLRSILTGMSLAAIPLFITNELGLGATAIGVTAGAQFFAAIFLRVSAGRVSDRCGSAQTLHWGVIGSIAGGVLCLVSYVLSGEAMMALGVLLLARIVLGGSESYMISGVQTWCVILAGPGRTGRAVGWVGTGVFSAVAVGAPLGSLLYHAVGFVSVGGLFVLCSTLILFVTRRLSPPPLGVSKELSLLHLASQLRVQATCNMLGAFSYAAILSFSALLFIERNWFPAWGALTSFSIGLVGARLLFGWLPDRIGGRRSGIVTLLVLAGGMGTIAIPENVWLGLLGASISGMGYAILFPSLIQEAVRKVDPSTHGTAMALITASNYLIMGLGSPAMGLLADHIGLATVFWIAAAAAAIAALVLAASDPVEKAQ